MNLTQGNIKIESIKNIILSIGFLIILIFPTVQKYFPVIPETESTENRKLADMPTIKLDYLDPFPSEFEKYYNDRFSLRNQLVSLKSLIIANTLHKTPMPDKVIFGKDNWLFLVSDELDTYRGKNLFKQRKIDKIVNELVRRQKYLKEKNISLYFVIAPTKYTIYPEYLPNYVDKINRITRTDQVKEALIENGIDVVDLRDTLINAKEKGLLYYKTDNHWNKLGSFIAYRSIIDKIKKDYPEIPALSLKDFTIKQKIKSGGNTARLINMGKKFEDIEYILEQKKPSQAKKVTGIGYPIPQDFKYKWEYEMDYETANDSLPSLLFIRDSFGTSLIPYISQSFKRSVFIFDNWNYTSNEHIIENEQPDIVVYLVLESFWNGFLTGVDKSEVNLQRLK